MISRAQTRRRLVPSPRPRSAGTRLTRNVGGGDGEDPQPTIGDRSIDLTVGIIAGAGRSFYVVDGVGTAIAVPRPVSSPDGQVSALVVSGPKNRLRGEQFSETVPEIIFGAANALELELSSAVE